MEKKGRQRYRSPLQVCLLAAACGLVIYVAGIAVMAWLIVREVLPASVDATAVSVWATVSAMLSGLAVMLLRVRRPVLVILATGALMVAVLLLVGWIAWGFPSMTEGNLWVLLSILLGTAMAVPVWGGSYRKRRFKGRR